MGVTTHSHPSGLKIRVDAREFNTMMDHIEDELAAEIARVVNRILSEAKSETRQFLVQKGRMVTGRGSAANKIALTLDYDRAEANLDQITAQMFAGPALTNPDDDGNQFDLAPVYEEGWAARMVRYTSSPASRTGRQLGRRGGNTPFIPGGAYFHPGFPKLGYMEHAQRIVESRLERRIRNKIESEYRPRSFEGRK